MKRSSKYLVIMLLVIAALSTAAAAYAAPPADGDHPGEPRPPCRELDGKVTAIGDSGITIVTQKEDSIDIAVSEETAILLDSGYILERGSPQDIEIGDSVGGVGTRADDGSVDAKIIVVKSEGQSLHAFESVIDVRRHRPDVVVVKDKPGREEEEESEEGEVTAIGDSGITIVTQKEDSIDIAVSEETEILLLATREQGSLQDIEIGDSVGGVGTRADDGSVDAKIIVVLPEGDMLGGKVTAVGDNEITMKFRLTNVYENRKGTALITTDDDTVIRIGKEISCMEDISEGQSPPVLVLLYKYRYSVGSMEDISEGQSLLAFGKLQEDGSLSADLVEVEDKPERKPPPPRADDAPPPPYPNCQ